MATQDPQEPQEPMSPTPSEAMDAEAPSGRRGWLARLMPRVGTSMVLSVLVHLAVAGLITLLIVLTAAPETLQPAGKVLVHLMDPGDAPAPPSPPPSPSGGAVTPPQPATPAGATAPETVQNPAQKQEKDENDAAAKEAKAIAEKVKETVKERVRKAKEAEARRAEAARQKQLEQMHRQQEEARRTAAANKAQLDKVRAELAANQARLAKAQRDAKKALDEAAKGMGDAKGSGELGSPTERQERWARWIVIDTLPTMEAAGGRFVLLDYPTEGKYMYISRVDQPRPTMTPGSRPQSLTFQPLDQNALAVYVMVCRRAGVTVPVGTYVPCAVFPLPFERKLTELERKEMARRGIKDPQWVRCTEFEIQSNGEPTLKDMYLQPGAPTQNP